MSLDSQSYLQYLRVPPTELIYRGLAEKQHLGPHRTLGEVLGEAGEMCPKAIESAVEWLQLDLDQKIGRLTRTELSQLAAAIQRFWAKSVE